MGCSVALCHKGNTVVYEHFICEIFDRRSFRDADLCIGYPDFCVLMISLPVETVSHQAEVYRYILLFVPGSALYSQSICLRLSSVGGDYLDRYISCPPLGISKASGDVQSFEALRSLPFICTFAFRIASAAALIMTLSTSPGIVTRIAVFGGLRGYMFSGQKHYALERSIFAHCPMSFLGNGVYRSLASVESP